MWGIGVRVLWVVRGDRCLMWEIGDRVLWGRSLFGEGIGDRVLGVVGRSLFGFEWVGDRVLGGEGRSLFDFEI